VDDCDHHATDPVVERLLRERIIVLGTQVDDASASAICAQLLLLSADDPDSDIHLYINSPGARSPPGWRSTTPCSSSPTTWPRS
jgi:ATP-dependent Clp endopeptidase proteolytic subunit ClpP